MSDLASWGSARDRADLDAFITRDPRDDEPEPEPRHVQPIPANARPFTWESQARQYPPRWDHPGIVLLHGDGPNGSFIPATDPRANATAIHCLLLYDSACRLVGILNHYQVACPPWEAAGNVNVWVRPTKQRRGYGTRLLADANRRWVLDPWQQRYSPAGLALAQRVWPDLATATLP